MKNKKFLSPKVVCICICLSLQLFSSNFAFAKYKAHHSTFTQQNNQDKSQLKKSTNVKSNKKTAKLKCKKRHSINKNIDEIARRQTSIIVNMHDKRILYASDADKKVYPASLTKVMTLYLLFEAIHKKKVNMSSHFRVSAKASAAQPCKLGLKVGDRVAVSDVVNALIVKSANDAAIVCAENIAGSEERFVKMMNNKALALGMNNSHFSNASGLHHPKQVSTASDMALLSLAIKNDFPQFYHLFAQTSFVFRGQRINGHNRVLADYKGATGLKTGYVARSGFNLITTARRNGKELLGVVTGGQTSASRDATMIHLLNQYFGIKPKNQ